MIEIINKLIALEEEVSQLRDKATGVDKRADLWAMRHYLEKAIEIAEELAREGE